MASELTPANSPVSVVLCTFNGERYVAEQLRSILEQSHVPREVIVSDDGSADRTLQIVTHLAESSAIPIRIVKNQKRLGYSDNFLAACRMASGDIIALSDQDDLWLPAKIEKQLAALLHTGAVMCAHDIYYMDSHGRHVPAKATQWSHRTRVLKPLCATPWGNYKGFTVMFYRRLLDLIPSEERGLDTHVEGDKLPHDRWLYFLATSFGSTIFLSERLAYYRQHGAQLFGATDSRPLSARIEVKIRSGERQSRYLASVAGYRSETLKCFAPEPPTSEWVKAGARWAGLRAHLNASVRIYECESIWGRTLVILQNLRRKVYAPFRFGGLGVERLVEDLLVSAAIEVRRRPRSNDVASGTR